MKFSHSWIKAHLDTTVSADIIADHLVQLGIEVEDLHNPASKLNGFVVGHVVKADRHPDADRLSLCMVENGDTNPDGTPIQYQVVCGAPNVRSNMKVAFASVGTVIPQTGLPLKKGVIRGLESQGMLCSTAELMLGADCDGIMDLPLSMTTGEGLATALQKDKSYAHLLDPQFDVSLTPNRSDCFSVRGLARDLAAADVGHLIAQNIPTISSSSAVIGASDIHITIDEEAIDIVPHFAVRVITNITNTVSPSWVQDRLVSAGCRPISALVDVTNYMCLDMGRPMHVFDYHKLKNKSLRITRSQGGEIFKALNDKDYILEKDMIIIVDAITNEVLSLAGVMGGRDTAVSESTTAIVLESAIFDESTIAFTGQKTVILSDARTRFERGVNAADVIPCLDMAIAYIQEWCGGTAFEIQQAGRYVTTPPAIKQITLTASKLHKIAGYVIDMETAKTVLQKLDFTLIQTVDDQSILVGVPIFRHDITLEVDLVEEVLRLIGFDHIPAVKLPYGAPKAHMNKRQRLSVYCTMQGYNETYTWSFTSRETARLFLNDTAQNVTLQKPLNNDMAVMRPSVLTGLLKIVHQAQSRSQHNSQFFEFASQFHHQEHGDNPIVEMPTLSAVRVFAKAKRHWQKAADPADFFTIKTEVLNILNLCGIQNIQIEAEGPTYYHNGRVATIKQGKNILAYLGELHPHILSEMGIEGTALAFEIFLSAMPSKEKATKGIKAFTPAIYQPMHRDFAFWVDRNVSAAQLMNAIQKVDKNLITQIAVFDVYDGPKAPADKKSVAVEVTLQPMHHTLSSEEVLDLQKRIAESVLKGCGGEMRDSAA